jgi:hypothetical protein
MLNAIQEFFKDITRCKNTQSAIDSYISSKYPQSVADIEYWTREYDRSTQSKGTGL